MLAEQLTDQTIEIYLQIAHTARDSSDSALSQKMLNAAYEQIRNSCLSANPTTLTNLAELLLLNQKLLQAEEIYSLAFKICKLSQAPNLWLLARILDGLTEVYAKQLHFERALKKCQQAIKIISAIPEVDPALLSSRVRKLALLNLQQGNTEVAQRLCVDAKHLLESRRRAR